jgi:PAS domain S-box-containing protein
MQENTSKSILQWAFAQSTDGMLVTDVQGKIITVNDAFCRMFGYSRDEIIGERTTFLKSSYSTQAFYREMWESLSTTDKWKGEIVNRKKDGEEITCFLSITPIIDDSGEKLGYLGVEIDLTERKMLESRIMQGEKLSEIGEAVASLAHEIRNPLNGISMNLYLLERARRTGEPWGENDEESLNLVRKEATRLKDMVDRVLSFARSTQLHYDRILVEDLLSETLSLVSTEALDRSVEIQTSISTEGLTLRCDPALVKQVLLNLVQNAIDAAAQSLLRKISIRVSHRAQSQDAVSASGMAVVFDIFDTGAGISAEHQESLFKPFFTTKAKGLGLGLASCAKIIREHHGSIKVISPLPQTDAPFNTQFSIALPA